MKVIQAELLFYGKQLLTLKNVALSLSEYFADFDDDYSKDTSHHYDYIAHKAEEDLEFLMEEMNQVELKMIRKDNHFCLGE